MTASEPRSSRSERAQRVRVRWNIFLFLFGFGFIAYLQQTQHHRGQLPDDAAAGPHAGADRLAPRCVRCSATRLHAVPRGAASVSASARAGCSSVIGLIAVIATLGAPLAPALLTGAACSRRCSPRSCCSAPAQGPIFPVSAGSLRDLVPRAAVAAGAGHLQSMGLQARRRSHAAAHRLAHVAPSTGSGRSPGARCRCSRSIAGWAWYGRNTPAEHPRVTHAGAGRARPAARRPRRFSRSLAARVGR